MRSVRFQQELSEIYGRMNTDLQVAFIDEAHVELSLLENLLRDSVAGFHPQLFDSLLERKVPVAGRFERGKTLLHLCAKIPDHITAAKRFARPNYSSW